MKFLSLLLLGAGALCEEGCKGCASLPSFTGAFFLRFFLQYLDVIVVSRGCDEVVEKNGTSCTQRDREKFILAFFTGVLFSEKVLVLIFWGLTVTQILAAYYKGSGVISVLAVAGCRDVSTKNVQGLCTLALFHWCKLF